MNKIMAGIMALLLCSTLSPAWADGRDGNGSDARTGGYRSPRNSDSALNQEPQSEPTPEQKDENNQILRLAAAMKIALETNIDKYPEVRDATLKMAKMRSLQVDFGSTYIAFHGKIHMGTYSDPYLSVEWEPFEAKGFRYVKSENKVVDVPLWRKLTHIIADKHALLQRATLESLSDKRANRALNIALKYILAESRNKKVNATVKKINDELTF
ncbi:MAG: hypothetical protein HY921_01725 [Elusimicrobia bacterium]|nr:hypothetical protein [Elusimicrobiota bacterium]